MVEGQRLTAVRNEFHPQIDETIKAIDRYLGFNRVLMMQNTRGQFVTESTTTSITDPKTGKKIVIRDEANYKAGSGMSGWGYEMPRRVLTTWVVDPDGSISDTAYLERKSGLYDYAHPPVPAVDGAETAVDIFTRNLAAAQAVQNQGVTADMTYFEEPRIPLQIPPARRRQARRT